MTRTLFVTGIVALGLLATGCRGERSSERAIQKTRLVDGRRDPIRWHATTRDRFPRMPMSSAPAATQVGEWSWSLPEGWLEQPATSMRRANFLVAGDPDAECYLTVLPGDAGGLAANVNRWRSQMGLEGLSGAEVQVLPTETFLGGAATLVDFEGSWSGMGGGGAASGYRLIGLLSVRSQESVFLKMVGPAAVIGPERENFLALARSFSGRGAEVPAQDPSGAATPPPQTRAGMSWSAPSGWKQGPERSFRVVTFVMGEDEPAECYVTVLPGDGGGPLANVNRWRQQMGESALDQEGFDGLFRIPMLGEEAVVCDARGSYAGMGGDQVSDALLLGAVCTLPGRTVFVKMVGPQATVEAQRDAFLDFCRSIEEEG